MAAFVNAISLEHGRSNKPSCSSMPKASSQKTGNLGVRWEETYSTSLIVYANPWDVIRSSYRTPCFEHSKESLLTALPFGKKKDHTDIVCVSSVEWLHLDKIQAGKASLSPRRQRCFSSLDSGIIGYRHKKENGIR
ncbi:MAG: hypothetical protein IJS54_04445 [Desulfovibrio sp.]|nr:hypothetical protein [Desulfovibrio sp.]